MSLRANKLNVVFVGPTNVGKSTLFNKMTRTRSAIVCDRPGVTVDRHELEVVREISNKDYLLNLVDTGGVGPTALEHPLGNEIEKAAKEALEVAHIIFFVVDGLSGYTHEEKEIASWLRKESQNLLDSAEIYTIANKVDAKAFDLSAFYATGFEGPLPISAEHGTGVDELWDIIDEKLIQISKEEETQEVEQKDSSIPKIIVMGRPNVGKSTLINTLIQDERHVVSDMPGTTRDVIKSDLFAGGMQWSLMDSAGMRRPGRQERGVEWVATQKLKDEAKNADLALIVVDSSEGITDLDAAIAGLAVDMGLGIVLVYNKWDKMESDEAHYDVNRFERTKDLKFDFLQWVPSTKISGLTGKGMKNLVRLLKEVHEARQLRVSTSKLNSLFVEKIKDHAHPLGPHSKPAKFYYIAQVSSNPPEFVMFTNIPGKAVHFSYKRFLINTLRREFGFLGTPIKIHFKPKKKKPHASP